MGRVERVLQTEVIPRRNGFIRALTTEYSYLRLKITLHVWKNIRPVCLYAFQNGEWDVTETSKVPDNEKHIPHSESLDLDEMEQYRYHSIKTSVQNYAPFCDAWVDSLIKFQAKLWRVNQHFLRMDLMDEPSILSQVQSYWNHPDRSRRDLYLPDLNTSVPSTAPPVTEKLYTIPENSVVGSNNSPHLRTVLENSALSVQDDSKDGSNALKKTSVHSAGGSLQRPANPRKSKERIGTRNLADDEDVCGKCMKSSPPPKGIVNVDDLLTVDWLQCNNCGLWYHNRCVGISRTVAEVIRYKCYNCKKPETASPLKRNKKRRL